MTLKGILRFILIIVLGAIFSRQGFAQTSENQFWMDYNLNKFVTEKLSYGGDAGLRGFISDKNWNQFILRPAVSYRFDQIFRVGGAMATFFTINKEEDNVFEYRLHQEVQIRWPDLGFLALFYRVRLEQRWFFYPNLENDFNGRGRLLVGVESQDFRFPGWRRRPFYLEAFWEGFKAFANQDAFEVFVNDVRIHTVLGIRFSDALRFEAQYFWQRSREGGDGSLETTQNVIRLRFFHTIRLKEDREPDP